MIESETYKGHPPRRMTFILICFNYPNTILTGILLFDDAATDSWPGIARWLCSEIIHSAMNNYSFAQNIFVPFAS